MFTAIMIALAIGFSFVFGVSIGWLQRIRYEETRKDVRKTKVAKTYDPWDNPLHASDPRLIKTVVEPLFGKPYVIYGDYEPTTLELYFGKRN